MSRETLEEAIASIREDSSAQDDYADRREELEWIVDQLCAMEDADFRRFIRSVRYQRKALACRGGMEIDV